MRPSLSVLEPGLERGVPWGRDLYTFVTSAAGHMMRTLQKPRKSRPSKRQVNHRRFLHNMIQRKFADIEAANHRLASALYFKEGEKGTSSLLSHKQDAPNSSGNPSQSDFLQDSEKSSVQTETEGISKSRTDTSTDSYEAEIRVKKPSDFGHCWKSHYKSTCATQMSRKSQKKEETHKLSGFSFINSPKEKDYFPEAELFCSEYDHDQRQFRPINNLSDNPQAPPSNPSASLFNQNDNNSPFSSGLSPLSLDSCDFSVQTFTDLTACSQDPKTITEGQLTDMVDLFSVGDSYSESCMEVVDYFDSICSCQDDAALKVCADLSDDTPGVEDLHLEEGEPKYRYSCQEDRSVTTDLLQDNQRSSGTSRQKERTEEKQFNNVKPSQSMDRSLNLLSTSISCGYNVTQPRTRQHLQEGLRLNNLNLTPFEGVAQSFSAPTHHHVHRPISTPPREDDWPFSDILKDRRSPYY